MCYHYARATEAKLASWAIASERHLLPVFLDEAFLSRLTLRITVTCQHLNQFGALAVRSQTTSDRIHLDPHHLSAHFDTDLGAVGHSVKAVMAELTLWIVRNCGTGLGVGCTGHGFGKTICTGAAVAAIVRFHLGATKPEV
jgi:hypothetical protein